MDKPCGLGLGLTLTQDEANFPNIPSRRGKFPQYSKSMWICSSTKGVWHAQCCLFYYSSLVQSLGQKKYNYIITVYFLSHGDFRVCLECFALTWNWRSVHTFIVWPCVAFISFLPFLVCILNRPLVSFLAIASTSDSEYSRASGSLRISSIATYPSVRQQDRNPIVTTRLSPETP